MDDQKKEKSKQLLAEGKQLKKTKRLKKNQHSNTFKD